MTRSRTRGARFLQATGVLALTAGLFAGCGSGDDAATTSTVEATTTTTIHPDDSAISLGFVALCNDGNYSDNRDFNATCSGGDGIDYWLSTFGRCEDGSIVVMESKPSCSGQGGFDTLMPRDFEPEAGADDVARCNDGNFSNNHDFRATCSGGDGVDAWLAPYGECSDGSVIEMSNSTSCPGGSTFVGLLPPDYTTTTTSSPPPTTIAAPQTIATPDLTGMPLDDAISELTAAGLEHTAIDIIEGRSIIVRSNWVVVEQTPPAGFPLLAGESVDLGVARPDEVDGANNGGSGGSDGDGVELTPDALASALAASWGRQTLIETCEDGSSFCFISDISISAGSFAIITAQIAERDEAFGENLASNVFTMVGLQFPDLEWVQVNNATGDVLANVQRSSVIGDQ